MDKRWRMLAVACAIGPASNAFAEYIEPHRCRPPFEDPFPNAFSQQSFQMELTSYRDCITKYVNQQREASVAHEHAASKAIREWNDYVTRMQK